jgi:hypothetical protein
MGALLTPLHHHVDGGRDEHATRGRRDRQRRHAWVSQLAQHQLTVELQCDHEEEQRHQGVVDPIPQRAGGLQRADPDADGQLPEAEKLVGPGGIGQDEGGDGDRQEDCAGRGLDAQERRKRFISQSTTSPGSRSKPGSACRP